MYITSRYDAQLEVPAMADAGILSELWRASLIFLYSHGESFCIKVCLNLESDKSETHRLWDPIPLPIEST